MAYVHDRMLDLMEAEGVNTLFGISDPNFVGLFLAAEARGWNVIAPHHEQAGAFMADGLSRLTGIPGVVVGNQRPGVANVAAAAICAAKENTPDDLSGGPTSPKVRPAYSQGELPVHSSAALLRRGDEVCGRDRVC